METERTLQKVGKGLLQGGIGFLCSMPGLMGYYPLVPAYFAANSMEQERSLLFYVGMLAGIGHFMSLNRIVKYVVILVAVSIAIRFYRWANGKCGGWAAGIIAGATTMLINFSGQALTLSDGQELILGISEGVLVLGLTLFFHFVYTMASELLAAIGQQPEEPLYEEGTYGNNSRMLAFATAVDGLSLAFSGAGQEQEMTMDDNVGSLERELTGRFCAACDGSGVCWEQKSGLLAGRMHQLVRAVAEHRSKDELLKNAYINDCPHYPVMVEEAVNAFGRMELNQAWYRRLKENRMVIAQQLDAMSGLLEDFNRKDRNLDSASRMLLARIAFEVKERGLLAQEVHIYEDEAGHRYVKARVSSKWGGGIPSSNYRKALEKAMHLSLRLEQDAKTVLTREPVVLTAYEDTVFYTMQGIAGKKKNGSSVSGDSFATFGLDSGRYFLCLSDGMGSGTQASQESGMVVELLQKFLEAGFGKETAIRMMNSAMVLKGEDNTFSTLDLADVDLYSGMLELTKIGGASTFLKHGGTVEVIRSSSLPAGVSLSPEAEVIKRELSNGDFLVMVTDGVLEYLHTKEPEAKLCEMIGDIDTDNAGILAKTLMDRVLLITGNYAMDDMTILTLGIWEK
jgi:stage II sporulation protein E